MESTLSEALRYVGEEYAFSPEQYPILRRLSLAQRRVFAMNHCQLHITKSLGRIAAACESADHGERLDEVELRAATGKIFTDVLKLAQEIGMTEEDLLARVHQLPKIA